MEAGVCVIFLGICLAAPTFKRPLPHLDNSSFILSLPHFKFLYASVFISRLSLFLPVHLCPIWAIQALDNHHCLLTVASYTFYTFFFRNFPVIFFSFLMHFRLTLSISPKLLRSIVLNVVTNSKRTDLSDTVIVYTVNLARSRITQGDNQHPSLCFPMAEALGQLPDAPVAMTSHCVTSSYPRTWYTFIIFLFKSSVCLLGTFKVFQLNSHTLIAFRHVFSLLTNNIEKLRELFWKFGFSFFFLWKIESSGSTESVLCQAASDCLLGRGLPPWKTWPHIAAASGCAPESPLLLPGPYVIWVWGFQQLVCRCSVESAMYTPCSTCSTCLRALSWSLRGFPSIPVSCLYSSLHLSFSLKTWVYVPLSIGHGARPEHSTGAQQHFWAQWKGLSFGGSWLALPGKQGWGGVCTVALETATTGFRSAFWNSSTWRAGFTR